MMHKPSNRLGCFPPFLSYTRRVQNDILRANRILIVMASGFNEGETAGPVAFYPYTENIFWNVFDFFGTLDREGRVISLDGSIFEQTKTDPKLLIGQPLAETVFWQASENTSRTVEEAINQAAGGKPSR